MGLDFALNKQFALSESKRLEFRGEMFNLPNHPNFAVPNGRVAFSSADAGGNGVVAPDWGVISATVTASRQVQLGLKLVF